MHGMTKPRFSWQEETGLVYSSNIQKSSQKGHGGPGRQQARRGYALQVSVRTAGTIVGQCPAIRHLVTFSLSSPGRKT